jgi:hypothetical protein
VYIVEVICYQMGGVLFIPHYECDPNPCPQLGACCFGCEECAYLLQEECMELPDWYQWIEGTPCDPNPCPPVATEPTTWGSIKADYR